MPNGITNIGALPSSYVAEPAATLRNVIGWLLNIVSFATKFSAHNPWENSAA
jgi:hypothetical protein